MRYIHSEEGRGWGGGSWKTAPAPSSGLKVVLFLLFCLLGGELAEARVLARAVQPDVGLHRPLPPRAVPDAARHVLEGGPHLLVLVGVDAGVHDGVQHRQQQQPALQLHHVAGAAVEAVQQEDHQAGGPADHEGACNRSGTVRLDSPDLMEFLRGRAVVTKIPGNKSCWECWWKRGHG